MDQVRRANINIEEVQNIVFEGAGAACCRIQLNTQPDDKLLYTLRSVNPDIIVLCHGGPISEPEDAQYILRHTKGIRGFFGASSIERLPTETAITACVKKFKAISL